MTYIAIDVGSSFIKAALLDTDKCKIGSVSRQKSPAKLHSVHSYVHEVDPTQIYAIIKAIIDEHVSNDRSVQGILLSTQMHGFVLCDEQGSEVTPYISWQDTRCLQPYNGGDLNYVERHSQLIDDDDLKKTGIKLKPGLAACNLFHWIQNNADVIRQKKKLHFFTLGSYLIYKLTGHNACHITNAAATGFADITKKEWSTNIIHATGSTMCVFPEILDEDQVCGYYTSAAGDIAVYPDIGDHQATILGTMAKAESDAVIIGGTAGLVSRISADTRVAAYENRPFFDQRVLQTVTRLPGGRNLDVLVQFIEDIGTRIFGVTMDRDRIWDGIYNEMETDNDNSVTMELGFFKEQIGVERGSITGIQARNLTVGSLFKGALLNLAEIYSVAVEKLTDPSVDITRLVLSGGLFHENTFLIDALGTASSREAVVSTVKEEALLGLLRIALKIDGQCTTLAETAQLLKEKEDTDV